MNNNKKLLKSTIILGVGLSATSLILPTLLNNKGVSEQEIILNNDSLNLGLERISNPTQSEMDKINSDVSTFNSDVNSLLKNSGDYGEKIKIKWKKTNSELRKILPSSLVNEKPGKYLEAEYLSGWGDTSSTTKFSNFNDAKGTVDLEWSGSYQWIYGTKYWFTKKGTIGGFGADMDGDGKIDSGKNTVLSKVERNSITLSDALVSELSTDPNNDYFIGKYIKTTSTDMPNVFSSSLEQNKFNYRIVKEPAIGQVIVRVTPKYVYSTSGLKTNMDFGSNAYSKEIIINNIGINRSTKANIKLLNTPESNEYFKHFTLEDIQANRPVGAAPFDWRKIASYELQTPYNQAVYSVNLTNFNILNRTFDMQVIADKAFTNGLLRENIMIGTLTIKVLNTSIFNPEDLDGDGQLDVDKTTTMTITENRDWNKKKRPSQVTIQDVKNNVDIKVKDSWMVKGSNGYFEPIPVVISITGTDNSKGTVEVNFLVDHSFKTVSSNLGSVCLDAGVLSINKIFGGFSTTPIVDLDGDGTLDENKTTSINIIKNSSFDKKYQADQVTLEIAKSWLNITVINPWMIKVNGGFIEGPTNIEIINADIQTGIVTVKVWVEHSFKMAPINDGQEVCVDGGELIQTYQITGLTIPQIVPEKDLDGDGVPDVAKQTELIVTQRSQPNLSLMASEVTLDNIKNWFSVEIKDSWKVVSPDGGFINTPVSTTIVSSENKKGEVVIKFKIFKSFKKIIIPGIPPIESCIEGGPIEVTKTITGFKILKPTVVSFGEYKIDNQANNSSESFSESDIKSYVFNNLITGGKPGNFNINNILVSNIERYNGRVIFNIQLNNFVDSNNNVVTTGFNLVKVTLTGFKVLKQTIINSQDFVIPGQGSVLTKDYTESQIKDFIMANEIIVGDKPLNFTKTNILLSAINKQNGRISVNVELNNWIDSNGKVVTTGFRPVSLVFTGFKTLIPTSIKNGEHTIPGENKNSSEHYTDNQIKDFIFNNNLVTGDKPNDFNISNIQLSNVKRLNSKIELSVILTNFIDRDGKVQNNSFQPVGLILSGFKEMVETTINNSSYVVPSQINVISDNYTEAQIKTFIFRNSSNNTIIRGDKPKDFQENNIILNNIIYNNGEIKVSVSLNNYIDSQGKVKTSNFNSVVITLTGFKVLRATTLVSGDYTVPSQINVLTADYTDASIKQYILNNNIIKGDKPDNFQISDIRLNNILRNNGDINVLVSLTNYINSDGKVVSNGFTEVPITLKGFKKLTATSISGGTYNISGQENVLSSNFSDDKISNFVFERLINNLPPDFNISNILLSNIVKTNGKISFDVTLNNYIDKDGKVQTSGFNVIRISFTGFKVLKETTVSFGEYTINGQNNISSEKYSEEEIRKFIFNTQIIQGDRPEGFAEGNIQLLTINRNNGNIKLAVSLNKFIDSEGNVKTSGFNPIQITLLGFKIMKETVINSGDYAISSQSDVLTKDFSDDKIKEYVYNSFGLIDGDLPINFTVRNIILQKIERKNGFITFSIILNNYINHEGKESTRDFVPVDIKLTGFKTLIPTSIVAGTYTVSGQSNTLSSNYDEDKIKTFIFSNSQIISGDKPEGFTKENIVLKTIERKNSQIRVSVELNRFINSQGEEIQGAGFYAMNLTLSGFLKVTPSIIISGDYNVPNQSKNSTEDYSDEMIKKYVFENIWIGDKLDITQNDVMLNKVTRLNGSITFEVILRKFINENGFVVSTGFSPSNIKLTGFKILDPTIIESITYQVFGYENKLATSENFDIAAIKNFVSEPSNAVVKGDLPKKWNTNMILISSPTYKNGEIVAVVRLTKCIDAEGKESNDFIPVEIKLTGFKRIKQTILIAQSGPILIKNQQNVVATSVDDDGIKDYIFNFNNLNSNIIIGGDFVPRFGANDIQINKKAVYDNLKGYISVEITLLRWYDENGEEQYLKPGLSLNPIKVELTGFKKIEPTRIKATDEYENLPINVGEIMDLTNRSANSFTIEDIKVLIIQIRTRIISGDVAQDFNRFDIIINENDVTYNNENGSIVVKISLKKWYDKNGFPMESNSGVGFEGNGTIMLEGFLKVIPKDNTILYASLGGGGGLLLLILIALAIYASKRKRALADQYDEYNDDEYYDENNQYLLEDQNNNEENYLEFESEEEETKFLE